MAHRGKDYPLAFRRDFSVNVDNYNHTNALVYRFNAGQVHGTLGTPLSALVIEMKNPTFFFPKSYVWRSDTRVIGGLAVYLLLYGTVVGHPTFIQPGWQCWTAGNVLLYQRDANQQLNHMGGQGSIPAFNFPQHETPGVIQFGGLGFDQWTAKPY
jgi:hypothetical protein